MSDSTKVIENVNKNSWLSTPVLVKAALLATLSIIFTRVFSFMIPLAGLPALRIGLGGIPIMVSGILFGPIVGAIVGVIADITGFMINPMGGSFFIGFTISAALNGFISGLAFKLIRERKSLKRMNFNIINGIAIFMFAIGVVWVAISKGALVIESGKFIYNGSVMPIWFVALFMLLVASFIFLPVYLTKYSSEESKNSIYSIDKIAFVVTLDYMIVALTLNTIWLSILFNKGVLVFLPGRILAGFVMIPLLSLILFSVSKLFKYV